MGEYWEQLKEFKEADDDLRKDYRTYSNSPGADLEKLKEYRRKKAEAVEALRREAHPYLPRGLEYIRRDLYDGLESTVWNDLQDLRWGRTSIDFYKDFYKSKVNI